MRRAGALLLAALLLTALAACDGTPIDADSGVPTATPGAGATGGAAAPVDESCRPRRSFPAMSPLPAPGAMPAGGQLAKIQARGRLILGTSQDALLFSSRNPITGAVEGFDVDMGRQIARAIFGDPDKIQIKVIGYDQRVPLAQAGTEVDLVAETMTVNCERWQKVNFSTVYYEAGQRVLVSKNSKVTSIRQLGGKKVCAPTGSTSLENIAKVATRPIPVGRPGFGDCLVAFQQNQVDAISSDDSILIGLAAQDPYTKVVGKKFTEEPYGMAMPKDAGDQFARFVNGVLAQNRADGTWRRTYRKWLGELGPAPEPPTAEYR